MTTRWSRSAPRSTTGGPDTVRGHRTNSSSHRACDWPAKNCQKQLQKVVGNFPRCIANMHDRFCMLYNLCADWKFHSSSSFHAACSIQHPASSIQPLIIMHACHMQCTFVMKNSTTCVQGTGARVMCMPSKLSCVIDLRHTRRGTWHFTKHSKN